ncbi:hypothetical protein JWG42_15205 [Desulfoprunum benzoelyticum]|uniref:Putative Fe-S center protein n=1 Tax=Desulfoprunum benzoelyticum TaxID=1506996 RepID=A0A840UV82_9BACT|nr:putative Fe-S center protein [Desulfoprunum benzoelyticum]MBM9531507.1 hypothetical protein [Desulfoprunum benzoelyticum]
MGHTFKKIFPDIDILASRYAVALDAVSLKLVEERAGFLRARLHPIPSPFS